MNTSQNSSFSPTKNANNTCDICTESNTFHLSFTCKHNICHKCFYKIIIRKYLSDLINGNEIKIPCICNQGYYKTTINEILAILTLLNENKDDNKKNNKTKEKCQIHNENILTDFCLDCKEEICEECKNENHSKHNFINSNDFIKECKEKINDLPNLNDLLNFYNEEIKNSYNNFINKLDEQFNYLMKSIEDYKNYIIQLLNEKKDNLINPMRLFYLMYKYYNYEKENISDDITQLLFLLNTKIIFPEINYNFPKIENDIQSLIKLVKNLNIDKSIKLIFKEKFLNCKILQNYENAHNSDISCLCVLSNNKLISGDYDGNLKLWKFSINGFNAIQKGKFHNGRINNLIYINYSKFASCSIKDNFILIWKENDKDERYQIIQKFIIGKDNWCLCLNNLNDNLSLISSFNDNKIHILKNENNEYKEFKNFIGHDRSINSIIQLKTNEIITGSDDQKIKVWKNFSISETLIGHKDFITIIIELNENKICSASSDKKIIVWERNNKNSKFQFKFILEGHTESIRTLIGLSDGRIISGSIDESIRIWILNSEKYVCKDVLTNNKKGVSCLAKINNEIFISGSWDKSIKVWVFTKE